MRLIPIILFLMIPCSVYCQDKPILSIENEKYDFGTVKKKNQQEIIVYFNFINTGSTPIVIHKADVSCGCMTVEYTKHPVKKGEKGIIKVTVDTKRQNGIFNKRIFIRSNAENDVVLLRISGTIK